MSKLGDRPKELVASARKVATEIADHNCPKGTTQEIFHPAMQSSSFAPIFEAIKAAYDLGRTNESDAWRTREQEIKTNDTLDAAIDALTDRLVGHVSQFPHAERILKIEHQKLIRAHIAPVLEAEREAMQDAKDIATDAIVSLENKLAETMKQLTAILDDTPNGDDSTGVDGPDACCISCGGGLELRMAHYPDMPSEPDGCFCIDPDCVRFKARYHEQNCGKL